MLPNERSGGECRWTHARSGKAGSGHCEEAQALLVEGDQKTSLGEMRVVELVNAEHPPASRYTLGLTAILDFFPVQRRRPLRHQRFDAFPIGHAAANTVKGGVACPFRVTHGPSEPDPVVIVPDAYHDPTLFACARECAPWRTIRRRVTPGSHAARINSLGKELVSQGGHEDLNLRHLYVGTGGAPIPPDHRCQCTESTHSPSQMVWMNGVTPRWALSVIEGPQPTQSASGLEGWAITGPVRLQTP